MISQLEERCDVGEGLRRTAEEGLRFDGYKRLHDCTVSESDSTDLAPFSYKALI